MPSRFGPSYNRQIPMRLIRCLNENAVRYEILHEPSDPSGSGRPFVTTLGFVEAVTLRARKHDFLAAVPARHTVDLKRFAKLIGEPVRLETEDEFKWLFPDCALGAIPPRG
jgi:Ala-tRNA(Pro) deacylase